MTSNLPTAIAAAAIVALTTTWNVLGLLATLRIREGGARHVRGDAPVTILKPLAGADPNLDENLASFFEQDHPCFEIVFGVTNPNDPALAVVERLRARYPQVPCKVVVHDGARGINPKIANLLGIVDEAAHDVVLVSDSNVIAPPHYVSEAVGILLDGDEPGLVTHLFCGAGEDGVGAALESVQLTGFCAAGTALPTTVGDALVVGKSMMFSRATMRRLGGLERVADVIAEDWLLGKTFQHAGLPVRLAPTVLRNVTRGTTLRAFFDRQLRWAMIRSRLRPVAQLLEVVASPLAMLLFAWLTMGLPLAGIWCLAVLWLRDVGGWLVMRGRQRAWIPVLLSPLRDVLMLAVWAAAPFKRHVRWRGHKVRLGMGTYGFVTVSPGRKARRVSNRDRRRGT